MGKYFSKRIKNGTLVLEHGCEKADLGIREEKIAAVLAPESDLEGEEEIDASGLYVFPGGIDTHTHFFEPGADYREDWFCGTRAAASGGYTLVMEMPNSSPPVVDEKTFALKLDLAKRQSVVDFALWGGAIAGNQDELEALSRLGCIAFKGFTLDAGPEFLWLDHQQQVDAMEQVKKLGKVLGFHAEDAAVIAELKERYKNRPWDLCLHDQARPYYAELTAIENAIIFAEHTGCAIHICHLSIPEGAECIKRAKERGVDVTAESCAHYFTLNYEDNFASGTYGLIQPPLRSRKRMEKMWEYLEDGTIDYLGTDHAPYTQEDKEPKDGDGWKVMGGAPSIDIAYPLMVTEGVIKRGMKPHRLAALCAGNAARRFGLYPDKGAIRVGADADLVLMDLEHPWNYTRKNSFSKTRCTRFPYEGRELLCRVVSTFLRGKEIYHWGEIRAEAGYGKLVRGKK